MNEKQTEAITDAIKTALVKLWDRIRKGEEFFGTNQNKGNKQ